ncbi:MAG: type II secretion system F family protein [Gemmataceae bacterium]
MLFSSSKCPLPALVAWCRTLKHSLGAGLDPVKVFRQQAKSGPRALRAVAADIAAKLSKGDSLEDSLAEHRDRFPPLFVELVAIGEQSGRLEDTFSELADYYETTLKVQRDFRSQMAYPAIMFIAAVFIISALIFILGLLGSGLDPLGLGLTGTAGAVTFLVVCFGLVGGILAFLKLSANSVQWRARIEGFLLIVPAWGPAMLNFAMHRFCIALLMTHEAALRTEKVVKYCFRATSNSAFIARESAAVAVVKKGGEIHEAVAGCGAPFPEEFKDMVEVGEVSGNMSELMEKLAKSYLEEASRRLKDAARFTSWLVYAMVAVLIILAIFSIATKRYINPINDMTKGI